MTPSKPIRNDSWTSAEIRVAKPEMPRPNITAEDIPWLMEPGCDICDVHRERVGGHLEKWMNCQGLNDLPDFGVYYLAFHPVRYMTVFELRPHGPTTGEESLSGDYMWGFPWRYFHAPRFSAHPTRCIHHHTLAVTFPALHHICWNIYVTTATTIRQTSVEEQILWKLNDVEQRCWTNQSCLPHIGWCWTGWWL